MAISVCFFFLVVFFFVVGVAGADKPQSTGMDSKFQWGTVMTHGCELRTTVCLRDLSDKIPSDASV